MERKFREFLGKTPQELFGIKNSSQKEDDPPIQYPINGFDLELMMDFLSKKKIGVFSPETNFINEIKWGNQPGAIKLEVDTGFTFFVKKLVFDKEGSERWIAKKAFQLNRNGAGNKEDFVAQEIFERLNIYSDEYIEHSSEEYKDLENLVEFLYKKMISTAKPIFFPEGIKKINDDSYIIKFGVKGQGLEFRNQQRVEQNQTLVTYDKNNGLIRVINYNLLSPTGKAHEFKINQNDLDVCFSPSQSKEEIADVLCVHMKFY